VRAHQAVRMKSNGGGVMFVFGMFFVAASQIVKCAIEEIADDVIEFLDAEEFERDELAGGNGIAGKNNAGVFANIASEMLFGKDLGINHFAEGNALAGANPAPIFVFGANGIVVRITNPIAEMLVKAENPRSEVSSGNALKGRCVLVGE
jgi:hypothetical protein